MIRVASKGSLGATTLVGELRPKALSTSGEFFFEGEAMAGTGRPRAADSRARRDEFLRLVFDGVDCKEAALRARVKPERALEILTPLIRPLLARAA